MAIGLSLFIAGIAGLSGFVALSMWEMRRGVRLFRALREKGDRLAAGAYRTLVFGEIPSVYRESLVAHARKGLHTLVNMLIALLRGVERPLARMSSRMRHRYERAEGVNRTPSPFLKDISGGESRRSKKGTDSL